MGALPWFYGLLRCFLARRNSGVLQFYLQVCLIRTSYVEVCRMDWTHRLCWLRPAVSWHCCPASLEAPADSQRETTIPRRQCTKRGAPAPGSVRTTSPMRHCSSARPAGDCGSRKPGPLGAQGGHPPTRNGLDQARLAGLLSVGAGVTAARALRSAGSSGLEGGAAASTRAALYPGEEASRRRPVTPGPAGPDGLQPQHSLAPLQRPLLRPTCRGPPRSHQPESETATSASPDPTTTSVRRAQPHSSEWSTLATGSRPRETLLGQFSATQPYLPLLLAV